MSETTTDTTSTTDEPGTGTQELAEIKALADELGITPGQLKGRVEASRKWEQRAKDNASAAAELEKLKAAALPDQERAIAEAKAAGRSEALRESQATVARAELKAAAAGRLPAGVIAALDTSAFVTSDGQVDTDAIAKFVEDNAPAPANTTDTGKPDLPDFGQGKRGETPALNSTQLERDLRAKLGVS